MRFTSARCHTGWCLALLLVALSACSGEEGGFGSDGGQDAQPSAQSEPASQPQAEPVRQGNTSTGGTDTAGAAEGADEESSPEAGASAEPQEGTASDDSAADPQDDASTNEEVIQPPPEDVDAPDESAGSGDDDEATAPEEEAEVPPAGPPLDEPEGDAGASDDADSTEPDNEGSAPPDDAEEGGEQPDSVGSDTSSGDESNEPDPEVAPAPMVTERRQLGERPYLVYRPDPVPTGSAAVLLLHAATENMDTVFDERRPSAAWKTLAERGQFILIAPNGTNTDGENDDDAAYWNDCSDNNRQTRLNSAADDLGFLTALIDWTVAAYEADPAQVYAYGLSNGGSMALRLAQEAPERIAGAVSVLGLAAEDGECVTPATPSPVMLMHGTEDPVARYGDGRGIFRDYLLGAEESYRFWLGLNGVDNDPERRIAFADREPADESTVGCRRQGEGARRVQLCTMEGAGHLDPSIQYVYGSGSRSFGRQNRDIESAVIAWAFLRDVAVGIPVAPE